MPCAVLLKRPFNKRIFRKKLRKLFHRLYENPIRLCAAMFILLFPAFCGSVQAGDCAATGTAELSQADVYQARMELKNKAGAYDFSSGAMDAAKACADLINRISSLSIDSKAIPGLDDIAEAVKKQAQDALNDTEEEACRYVAQTGRSWISSQLGLIRTESNAKASQLAGAHVSVSNPSLRAVLGTYRTRLMGTLPRYSDMPGLK